MAGAVFKIAGADAFEQALGLLPAKMSKKIVRKSVRAGQKPTLVRAKSNANSMVGGQMGALIAKKTKIKGPKRQKRGQYSLGVVVTADDAFFEISKAGDRNYIPAAIEYGHGQDKEKAAIPFMLQAGESQRPKSLIELRKELRIGIDKAIREETRAGIK